METFFIAVVAVVGVVVVLNLLLTVGVVRRLREHTERLATLGGSPGAATLAAGQRVGEFATTAIGGEPVACDLLPGRALVGAFTSGCGACAERLPDFLVRAKGFPAFGLLDAERVVVVASGWTLDHLSLESPAVT